MGVTSPHSGAQASSRVPTDTKSNTVEGTHARASRNYLGWLNPCTLAAGLLSALPILLQQHSSTRLQLQNDKIEAEQHFKVQIKQLVKQLNHEAAIEAERVRADILAKADHKRRIRHWRRGVVLQDSAEEPLPATRRDSSILGGDDLDEQFPQAGLDVEDLEELFPQAGIDIDPSFAADLAMIVERMRLDVEEE